MSIDRLAIVTEVHDNIERSVKRGVRLLDRKVPDWREEIVTGELDMASGQACILGQVFMDKINGFRTGYEAGVDVLGLEGEDSQYGFNYPINMPQNYQHFVDAEAVWSALAEEWVRQINKKRSWLRRLFRR